MDYFGLFNINKPAGMTSRRVVDHVARLVRPAKAGHAGTLDPLARGVLIVCVGKATRLIDYVQQSAKRYIGTFLFGRRSDTEDIEGHVEFLADPPQPSPEEIGRAAKRFVGQILQRPPAFSAVKISGRRAYDLARAGQAVELAPGPVVIHSIEVVRYEYPELALHIRCGSGTYIRSLGRDLAESLGTAAVMSDLVRTEIGSFRLEDACALGDLTPQTLGKFLLPARRAVDHLPAIELSPAECQRVSRGIYISRTSIPDAIEFAALTRDGELAAILTRDGERLRPSRNWAARRWR